VWGRPAFILLRQAGGIPIIDKSFQSGRRDSSEGIPLGESLPIGKQARHPAWEADQHYSRQWRVVTPAAS